jgi:large subunit ribosomal protein L21
MYAVVKIGGKQYRVEEGDSILVDRLPDGEGEKVVLEPLLYADDKKAVFERADLEKVKVEGVVQGHERGPKIHVLKFKPKKGYKRRTGHRSELTRIEIGDIKLLSRKPAGKKAGEDEEKPSKPKAAAKKPATRKPASKKPAAKGRSGGSRSTQRKKQEKDDGS